MSTPEQRRCTCIGTITGNHFGDCPQAKSAEAQSGTVSAGSGLPKRIEREERDARLATTRAETVVDALETLGGDARLASEDARECCVDDKFSSAVCPMCGRPGVDLKGQPDARLASEDATRDPRVLRIEEILLREFPGELGAIDDLRQLEAALPSPAETDAETLAETVADALNGLTEYGRGLDALAGLVTLVEQREREILHMRTHRLSVAQSEIRMKRATELVALVEQLTSERDDLDVKLAWTKAGLASAQLKAAQANDAADDAEALLARHRQAEKELWGWAIWLSEQDGLGEIVLDPDTAKRLQRDLEAALASGGDAEEQQAAHLGEDETPHGERAR